MEIGAGSIGLGFLAGVLSTLSPCVLPLLPLVLGGAAAAHRWGMLALAAGLVASFVGVGMFVATIGFSIGLDAEVFRMGSAVLLAALGLVLLSGALQARFAMAASGVGDAGNRLLARWSPGGLGGQAVIGLVLGAIWSPCVGPTLGAASVLAAQGQSLGAVALVMAAFGLGAAVPLVLVGSLSREAMKRWRGRLMGAGQAGKRAMGVAALAVALFIATGWDKAVEAALVRASPEWLTDLTTRF
jgi:cytochrome c biogenesis protein CcdA